MPTDPKRNKKRTLRIVGTALEDALLYLAKVTCTPEGDVIQHLMKVRPGYAFSSGSRALDSLRAHGLVQVSQRQGPSSLDIINRIAQAPAAQHEAIDAQVVASEMASLTAAGRTAAHVADMRLKVQAHFGHLSDPGARAWREFAHTVYELALHSRGESVMSPRDVANEARMTGSEKPDLIEAKLNAIISDPEDAWKRYCDLEESAHGRVINVDICRNLAPEYGATGPALRKRRTFYTEATFKPAKSASRIFFERQVARSKGTDILFTGGGPASGKTTALKNVGADTLQRFGLILDTSLTNLTEVVQQIRLCHQHQHTVHITWVYCPFPKAIEHMLARATRIGRYITLTRMAVLHKSSHEAMLHLADHIDRYSSPRQLLVLHVIDSTGTAPDLTVVGNGAKPTAAEKRMVSDIRRLVADNLTRITDENAHHAFEAFRHHLPLPRDLAHAVQR